MKTLQLNKIKEHYEAVQNELINSISTKQMVEDELDIEGDVVDEIQGQSIHQMAKALSVRDMHRLSLVQNALFIIANAGVTIDECDECADSIGEKRLLAIPGVRICVNCAEELESKTKMFA